MPMMDDTTQKNQAERSRARQRWMTRLAAAISGRAALDDVLHMVRDGVVKAAGVDRAALFLYDAAQRVVYGTWGTDRQGRLEDISAQRYLVTEDDPFPLQRVVRGELAFHLTANHTDDMALGPEDPMYG